MAACKLGVVIARLIAMQREQTLFFEQLYTKKLPHLSVHWK